MEQGAGSMIGAYTGADLPANGEGSPVQDQDRSPLREPPITAILSCWGTARGD